MLQHDEGAAQLQYGAPFCRRLWAGTAPLGCIPCVLRVGPNPRFARLTKTTTLTTLSNEANRKLLADFGGVEHVTFT